MIELKIFNDYINFEVNLKTFIFSISSCGDDWYWYRRIFIIVNWSVVFVVSSETIDIFHWPCGPLSWLKNNDFDKYLPTRNPN